MEGYEVKPTQKKREPRFILADPIILGDRASNENCNGLIRYFIQKGTDINTIDKKTSIDINNKINQKEKEDT